MGLWPWVLKAGGPTCYGGFHFVLSFFYVFVLCSACCPEHHMELQLLIGRMVLYYHKCSWIYWTLKVDACKVPSFFKFKDLAPPLWHPPTIYLISLIYIFLNIIKKLWIPCLLTICLYFILNTFEGKKCNKFYFLCQWKWEMCFLFHMFD